VGHHIDTDDVIDVQGVAELLGLAQRNTVALCQRRYTETPRLVIDLERGRCELWSHEEREVWAEARGR